MTTETVTAEVVETTTATETQTQPAGKTPAELQAELARVEAALKDANKEAASRRKKLEEFEKAEQARKDAELSETERLKKELQSAQSKLEAAQRTELQRSVSDEVGLPAVFAARIQGADRDAMLADAKAILAVLPKGTTLAPKIGPTNPGAATKGETDDEKRRRLGLR
jgi:hypothetical protein